MDILTPLQIQILDLLANYNYTPYDIARKLRIDEDTLDQQRSMIRQLLNVNTDLGAVKAAIKAGITEYR